MTCPRRGAQRRHGALDREDKQNGQVAGRAPLRPARVGGATLRLSHLRPRRPLRGATRLSRSRLPRQLPRRTERAWSPNNLDPAAGRLELERIQEDSAAYLATQDDRKGKGEPIRLPDGSLVPRLPGHCRWIWDGEFAGVVSLRWQPGTAALPPHVLGHIGYAVVPWKRRRGYATAALQQFLPEVIELGLPYVGLTTDANNIASQKVITANGGVLIETFTKPAAFCRDSPALRWQIPLSDG